MPIYPINPVAATANNAAMTLQHYPAMLDDYRMLLRAATAAEDIARSESQRSGVPIPASVRNATRSLNRATTNAATRLAELRQKLREAVAHADRAGRITSQDREVLTESGLLGPTHGGLGYIGNGIASPVAVASSHNISSVAASTKAGGGSVVTGSPGSLKGFGLGYIGDGLRSPMAAANSSAASIASKAGGSVSIITGTGDGVIGYGLGALMIPAALAWAVILVAAGIGGAILYGGIIALRNLTAPALADADNARAAALASIQEWQREIQRTRPPGTSPAPLPDLPSFPRAQSGNGSSSLILVAALGVAAYLAFGRK